MNCRTIISKNWRAAIAAAVIGLGSLWAVALPLQQGEEEDSTRRLWNKSFEEARNRTRPKRPAKPSAAGELVGVTIWRLRESSGSEDLNFERVAANTSFSEGERVRLSVEVPHEGEGYLYVIDREVYADGTKGDPYLIFPSRSTPPGGNVVTAGKLVYVPAQRDPIPYFTLERSRKDHVREGLTILVTPKPLNLQLGDKDNPSKLDIARVAQWEKLWGGSVEQREAQGGMGKEWTLAERSAASGERRLVQGDPLPQTIYRVKGKPGTPIALKVPLLITP